MLKGTRKLQGIAVAAEPGESVDRLIRRFTRKVRDSGVLQELYNRRHFEKPSVRRRRKSSRARITALSEKSRKSS